MAGLKRKEAPKATVSKAALPGPQKKQKTKAESKPKAKLAPVGADLPESDTTEDDDDFEGFPAGTVKDDGSSGASDNDDGRPAAAKKESKGSKDGADGDKKFKVQTTSAEAHAQQRALAKERKLNKPNADSLQRSKKIWERLRRKSHVPLDERKALVAELFDIVTGRVREFVFKHDSVRVIQCALKYANKEQKKSIMRELKEDTRPLAESKYGKFLIGKMVVEGDTEIRNMIIPEFYGHIRRLINHPEAAWIVDDIYRQIATPAQKALMLREWYGAEYAVFAKNKNVAQVSNDAPSADLKAILAESPEKRKPIMQYLHQLINSLVQKKMTGFTMLHDAMLQYFLNTIPGNEEATEFLELLKSDLDEEAGGDLLKNLAFTKSGSRVVCLALAYGSAKDRKVILRVYKDTIEMMALDAHAHIVLLAALDVTDDTKMSAKAVLPELLGETIKDEEEREERLMTLATNLTPRIPLLYLLAGPAKWLLTDDDKALLDEVHAIRAATSKKDAATRTAELVASLAPPLLALVQHRAPALAASSFGTQCITEVLLEGVGDKHAACAAVADLAAGDPSDATHVAHNPAVGKMMRALVVGGKFDAASKAVVPSDPELGFARVLLDVVRPHLLAWACGPSSFVVVALLESAGLADDEREEVRAVLAKGRKKLEKAAAGEGQGKAEVEAAEGGEQQGKTAKKRKVAEKPRGNAGARILLEKLGGA